MTQLMPAVVFEDVGKWALRERPIPIISSPKDVLLQVDAVGICGSDLQILSVPPGQMATPGTILGHEFVGTVVQVGDSVRYLSPGDRVVGDPEVKCGSCRYCLKGMPNYCTDLKSYGHHFDGALARMMVMPESGLYKIPTALSSGIAVFAEPLACVVNGFGELESHIEDRALVFGAGPIGLMFVMLLRAAGVAQVMCSEPILGRRDKATELGASHVFDPTSSDIAEEVARVTDGEGVDIVVDCVGTMFPEAINIASRGAQILLFGDNVRASREVKQGLVTRKGLRVRGSFITRFTFPKAIDLLASGKLNVSALVTHRVGLSEFGEAYQALKQGGAIKALVFP